MRAARRKRRGWMADDDTGALRGRDLLGLGGILVAGVVLGLVVGLLIDYAADTSPVFTLIGIAVGIALACFGFWVRVRDALRSDMGHDMDRDDLGKGDR